MSQIISIKRRISHQELTEVIRGFTDFKIGQEQSWGITITYTPNTDEHLIFVNGEFQATSPGDRIFKELEKVATALKAEIVHEDEEIIPPVKTNFQNMRLDYFVGLFYPRIPGTRLHSAMDIYVCRCLWWCAYRHWSMV